MQLANLFKKVSFKIISLNSVTIEKVLPFILLNLDHMHEQARNEICLQHVIGTVLFIIAFHQQHIVHVTLANLRKSNLKFY